MDDGKLTLGGIISIGVLASSLVLGSEASTCTTLLEPEANLNSEYRHEIILDDNPDYLKEGALFSFQYDQIKIGIDIEEDEYPDIAPIEIPITKKVLFQFKKPVRLEFV